MEALLFIFVIILYLLPSILGFNRRNGGSIILLNVFLGWTVVGWIFALMWSIKD